MNKRMMIGLLAVMTVFGAQAETTLAEARSQIGEVLSNPSLMTAIVKQLPPEMQTNYLASVNAAIEKLPGSNVERAAKFANINIAAAKGASGSKNGGVINMVAESFATVPLAALTTVSEAFAEAFSVAKSEKTYTEEQLTNMFTPMMEKMLARNQSADHTAERNTLGLVMILNATGNKSPALSDSLMSMFPNDENKFAIENEWLPAAMGPNPNYDPILGAGQVTEELPSPTMVLQISGPQAPSVLLADLTAGGNSMEMSMAASGLVDQAIPNPIDMGSGLDRVPRTDDITKPWYGDEPRGYYGQSI